MRLSVCVAMLGGVLAVASPAAAAPAAIGGAVRSWSVSRIDQGTGAVRVAHGVQRKGRLDRVFDLGDEAFNTGPGFSFGGNLVPGRAAGWVSASADGSQSLAFASAPDFNPFEAHSPKGGATHLDISQAYEKRGRDATLRITLDDVLLHLIDENGPRLAPAECPAAQRCRSIRAIVRFRARAWQVAGGHEFFDSGGAVYAEGHQGAWFVAAATLPDSRRSFWTDEEFHVVRDLDANGSGARLEVKSTEAHPVTLKVPLGSVSRGTLFGVHVTLDAEAIDDRGHESAASAFVVDPEHPSPGLSARGLAARGGAKLKEPKPHARPAARCPGGGVRPHAGTLQLSSGAYTAGEASGTPMVLVTRTGGSRGAASVVVSATGGSALPGRDFAPTRTLVRFEPGDTSPRLVDIPVLEDTALEAPEQLTVSLAHARCAGLGARHAASVTILDDDEPPAVPASDPPPPAPTSTPAPPPPTPAGLDTTFGTQGRVSTPGGGEARAVLIQPDGHIVAVGRRAVGVNFHFQFGAVRYDGAGNVDPGFGTGGIATTSLGGSIDEANDAALLPDGGFVAVGDTDVHGIIDADFGVARYTADGHPAPGFGGDAGFVTTDVAGRGDAARAVAVQPDGKIVVAGSAQTSPIDSDFALARYNPDGTLDHGFGGDGIVTTDLGTEDDAATGVAIQPDGRIVAAGSRTEDAGLARYLPDGSLDRTFGGDGTVVGGIGTNVVTGVALTPGGTILISGSKGGPGTGLDIIVASYAPNGELNLGFGRGGVAQTDLSGSGGFDLGNDLVVDSAGGIVVVGSATSSTVKDMALVRLEPDGTLDRSLTADFHGHGDDGYALAIDAHGGIVAAGSTLDTADPEFALMRAFL